MAGVAIGCGHVGVAGRRRGVLRGHPRLLAAIVLASGEAHDDSLHATGSGSADLGKLVAQQANVRISGSAEADLAPREDADIAITGSGVVRLHGGAARVRSHVTGSGQIKQVP